MKRNLILITSTLQSLLFFSAISYGQCPASATMVVKESRCKENGSITVNANPAGAYTYEIISGPEVVALSSSNVFTGLGAGNYIISVYGSSCSRSFNVTVPGNYQDPGLLTGTIQNITCPGASGCINVTEPSNGRKPYSYSIISGPLTKPVQSSTSFCGLPAGDYAVQALDSCGVVRTSQFSIGVDTGSFEAYVYEWEVEYLNCNDLMLPVRKFYTNTSAHSLLRVWYVTPSGDTLKVNDFNNSYQDYDTLYNHTREYGTWQVLVYDECGRMKVSTFNRYDERQGTGHYVETSEPQCNGLNAVVGKSWKYGVGVGFVVRRCTDNSIVFSEYQPANSNWSSNTFLMNYDSCYLVESYDECGDTVRSTYTAPSKPVPEIIGGAIPSCNAANKAQVWVYDSHNNAPKPITFTIINGPAGEIGKTTSLIGRWDTYAGFGDVAEGTYSVAYIDACGKRDTLPGIEARANLVRTFEVVQTPHCSGGANLHVKLTSNLGFENYNFWYPQFVDRTEPARSPVNLVVTPTVSISAPGIWEADYINVTDTALMFRTRSDFGGCDLDTLVKIIKYIPPTLNNVSGYVCNSNNIGTINYNVNNGVAPFRYRIKPDNSSVWGAWQDSSVFTGITAGTYDVNVEDGCPNGSIRSVSFLNWKKSEVAISSPCATIGAPLTLAADPAVNLVSYQWLLNNAIVGTGSSYTIPSYAPSNEGVYKLRQVFRGGTCIDSASTWLLTCSILPITLSDFSGELQNDIATLQWKTLTDIGAMKFIVESSLDGTSFKKIGEVINSNSFEGSNYRFVDNQPGIQTFYRIAYYTDPGMIYYSPVINLAKNIQPGENTMVSLSPVPFKNKFQVQVYTMQPTNLTIKLYDVTGKKMLQKAAAVTTGNNIILLSGEVANLNTGYYFVEISGDHFLQRKKIIKE